MDLLRSMQETGHEQVSLFHCPVTGLRALVALHSTVLGPAFGGLRMWPYASTDEALTDALRLSRAMTYQAAIAGLDLGGGKAVVIGDPELDKSEALLRSLGRFVDAQGGRLVLSWDVGTSPEDMETVRLETPHAVGLPAGHGGSGDPSPATALGTLHGMRACLESALGHCELGAASYAVQGAGHVGQHLVRLLRDRGAKVFVSDLDEDRVQALVDELGVESVPMQQIFDVDATVLAPCAMGGVINEDTIPRLRCRIVAGSANNQLENTACGTELQARGILYAPDFAINCGGLMNVALELGGYDADLAERKVATIYTTIARIIERSEREGLPTWQAAERMAEDRIETLGRLKRYDGQPRRRSTFPRP